MKRLQVFVIGIFVALAALSFSISIVAQDNAEDMESAHIETILRITEEAFNQGNLDVIDELFAEDYISYDNNGVEGDREAFKAFIVAARDAMPDYEARVDLMVVNGDWMAFRFKSSGTFENEFAFFPGLPPTGEQVDINVHVILRFNEAGQLVEEWDLFDNLLMLSGLGIIPPMEDDT